MRSTSDQTRCMQIVQTGVFDESVRVSWLTGRLKSGSEWLCVAVRVGVALGYDLCLYLPAACYLCVGLCRWSVVLCLCGSVGI